MAILTIRKELEACHGTKEPKTAIFIVEVSVRGPIMGDFVASWDDAHLRAKVDSLLDSLRGKWLDDLVGRATLENLAAFLIAELNHSIAIDAVSVRMDKTAVKVYAEEINPDTWPAELAFRRGVSLLLRSRERSALNEFSLAINFAPGWAVAYNARGRCYRRLRAHDKALADFERAIREMPDFGEAHRNKANILLESGRTEESLESFDRAVELLPMSALAYNNRGYAYQQIQEYIRAVADHEHAVKLDSTYADAFQDLATALERMGRTSEARVAYDEAERLQPLVDETEVERVKLFYSPCLTKHLPIESVDRAPT